MKKLAFKMCVLAILTTGYLAIHNPVGAAVTCESDYYSCLQNSANSYAYCANNYNACLYGGGGTPNPDYCPTVYQQREQCAGMYSPPTEENRADYWMCYGAIEHNSECLGYTPE